MPEQVFKTLSFPPDRTRSGRAAKVTIAIPASPNGSGLDVSTLGELRSFSGVEIRAALGDPLLEDLERLAMREGMSLGEACLRLLAARRGGGKIGRQEDPRQQHFHFEEEIVASGAVHNGDSGFGVTFRESHRLPVHGWYPYIEGFSAHYVRDALLRFGQKPSSVYDPFGGAGTTMLVASMLGIPSFYAEVNPFMAFVAEAKVVAARWASQNLAVVRRVAAAYLDKLNDGTLDRVGDEIDLGPYHRAFPSRDFFEEAHLRRLLAAKRLAEDVGAGYPQIRSLLLVACAANVVRSSNMTRRADLRRRRADEYKTRVVNVGTFVAESVRRMLGDLSQLPPIMADSAMVSADSRQLPASLADEFGIAITSPPYLNGTNYFRNAKLELWFLGFIDSESDLGAFRRRTVCAGINDVSSDRPTPTVFEPVEQVARRLDVCTKDRRIPAMIRHYFSDMARVLGEILRALQPGGHLLLDIGDSRFYGVHVPSDVLLAGVAESVGFRVEHKSSLARRYSKGGDELGQFELVMSKPRARLTGGSRASRLPIEERIRNFSETLPFKAAPYSQRNWGHPLHSLCSYQGKLKPSIAYWLVRDFVPEGGRVLDPLGGVGTVAFEAAQSGRPAVSNDKGPFASVVARAKLDPPSLAQALSAVDTLAEEMRGIQLAAEDFRAAKFGLNAAVEDYYHPETLEEVLRARALFLKGNLDDRAGSFLWAALLHILHGNRPYALSRNSHPITPFNPTGPIEHRPLIPRLRAKVELALGEPLSGAFVPGRGIRGDFRSLEEAGVGRFDAIITSPPFLGMRFDRPNWLRLWFCGWGESDFHNQSLGFLERQQTEDMDCYLDFFRTCRQHLEPNGILIVHIGSSEADAMPQQLAERARGRFDLLVVVSESVETLEKHGLRDKGRTKAHNFLFFRPL